jgi:ribosomal protein L11 methyltransferase
MPKEWLELSISTPAEFVEPLAEIFRRASGQQVVIEEQGGFNPDEGESPPSDAPVIVKIYVPRDKKADQIKGQIDLAARLVAAIAPVSDLKQRIIHEKDWANAWKAHFHILHIGKNIVIVPTWLEHKQKPSDLLIHLDPGMAFGTGHHPTTKLCLEILEKVVKPQMNLLDLGTGSGILTIAAISLGARSVVALDTDALAVKATRLNLKMNNVGNKVVVNQGTLPHTKAPNQSFDIAIANISAKIVLEQVQNLLHALVPGGLLLVSGMIEERVHEVTSRIEELGASLECHAIESDWNALLFSKAKT